jgi:dTDP-4-dehydrorhamnose 3,5-epimerase
MAVQFTSAPIPGVVVCQPDVYPDDRGYFTETYRADLYARNGVAGPFVQDNRSHSVRGILRGLHYQIAQAQAKLVSVVRGEVFDAVVDLRRGSPAFGKWFGLVLSAENRRQLYVPEGLAHGFCVLSDTADVAYKCSNYYHPGAERGLLWSDPDVGIQWPNPHPVLSPRDAGHARLKDIPEHELPRYTP